jgi:hypothetical protein
MVQMENESPAKRKRVQSNVAYPMPKNMGKSQYMKDFNPFAEKVKPEIINKEIESQKTFIALMHKNKFKSDNMTTTGTSFLHRTLDNDGRL